MADGLRGRAFKVQAGDGASPEVFADIGKVTSLSYTMSQAVVEQTSKDDAPNRQLLENTGIRSFTAEVAGFWDASSTQEAAEAKLRAGTIDNYRILDGANTISGAMQVSSFSLTGGVDDVTTWALTLEGSGTVTYAS